MYDFPIIQVYCSDIRVSKGTSPNTIRAYENDIGEFLEYFLLPEFLPDLDDSLSSNISVDTEWDTALQSAYDSLEAKLVSLPELELAQAAEQYYGLQGSQPTTISRKYAAIRQFLKWLWRHKSFSGLPPTNAFESPDVPWKAPATLTTPEILRILVSASMTRHRATICLLCEGLKPLEVIRLNWEDVIFGDMGCQIIVRNRRGKKRQRIDQPIDVAAYTADMLQKLWDICSRSKRGSGSRTAVFRNRFGVRISSRSLRKDMTACALRARIGKDVNPYMFRNTFMSDSLSRGESIAAIRKRTGIIHSSTVLNHAPRLRSENDESNGK